MMSPFASHLRFLLPLSLLLAVSAPALAQEPEKKKNSKNGQEVTVTGSRVATENQNLPADLKVTTRARIHRPGSRNALTALTDVSGVKLNLRQDNAIFSDVEVRGLAGNSTSGGNVLILLDGIPQHRLSFGGPYMGALPFDSIVRMELVKGPTSSLYGRGALAGALQLFSDPGSYDPHTQLSALYEFPSNTVRSAVHTSGPLSSKPIGGNRLPTYSLTGSLGYTGGWQPRTQAQKNDLYLHAELPLSREDPLPILGGFFDGREAAVAPVFVDKNGNRIFGLSREDNLAVPGQNSMDLREMRLATRYTRSWSPQLKNILTVAFWRGDTYSKVGRPDDYTLGPTGPSSVIARSSSDRHFLEHSIFAEADVSYRYNATPWLSGALVAGLSYEYLTFRMTSSNITTRDAFAIGGKYTQGIPLDLANGRETGKKAWLYEDMTQRDTFEHNSGIYARKQVAVFDRVFFAGGMRFDTFRRIQENPATGERAERSDSAVSPNLGLSVAVLKESSHRVNVFAGWGRGFSPVFRAVNNTQFANINPESSESIEAGVKTQFFDRRAELTATAYQLDRHDIVATNPANNNISENVGDWRIRGVETDLRVRPIANLVIYGALAIRSPRIEKYRLDPTLEGNKVPAISSRMLTSGAEYQTPVGVGVGSEVRFVSSFYGNEQNSFRLPAYTLWDAWVHYDHKTLFRAALYVKNLLDSDYYTAVFNSTVKNGSAFAGPPRSYGVSLSARF